MRVNIVKWFQIYRPLAAKWRDTSRYIIPRRNYVARYVPSLNMALQIMPVAPIKRVIDKINLSNSLAAALLMARLLGSATSLWFRGVYTSVVLIQSFTRARAGAGSSASCHGKLRLTFRGGVYARSLAIFTSTYAVAINSLLRLISAYRKAIIEPLPRAVGENGVHRRYRGTLHGDRVGVRVPFISKKKKSKLASEKQLCNVWS